MRKNQGEQIGGKIRETKQWKWIGEKSEYGINRENKEGKNLLKNGGKIWSKIGGKIFGKNMEKVGEKIVKKVVRKIE